MSYLERYFSLRNKVALVTGASRGLGAEMALALAQAGARTIGLGRSAVALARRPQLTTEEATNLEYVSCDLLAAGQFPDLCERVFAAHGRIDILVNAAGITVPKSAGADSILDFERTLATNLSAVHHCCQNVAAYMRRNTGGSIINITSIGSVLGFPGNPAYVASKGGLRLLTKALAFDYAPYNIRVNNLAPGYMRTDMTEASFQDPVRHAERLHHMMIKRWGTPDDLVGAVIFLASGASSYVTGTDLFVDGGWTAKGM